MRLRKLKVAFIELLGLALERFGPLRISAVDGSSAVGAKGRWEAVYEGFVFAILDSVHYQAANHCNLIIAHLILKETVGEPREVFMLRRSKLFLLFRLLHLLLQQG